MYDTAMVKWVRPHVMKLTWQLVFASAATLKGSRFTVFKPVPDPKLREMEQAVEVPVKAPKRRRLTMNFIFLFRSAWICRRSNQSMIDLHF